MNTLTTYARIGWCLLALVIATACATEKEDSFLECQGLCDSIGSLDLSARWVPVGGSIRAQTQGSLTVTPQAGAHLRAREGGRWIITFSQPGYFTLHHQGDSAVIRVSDEGLNIQLLSPVPAEFVTTSESEALVVRGRITDPLGQPISQAKVAGQSIRLDAQGEFETNWVSQFGINTVEISASDHAGNKFDTARSFMAARAFSKAPTRSFIQLDAEALAFIADGLESDLGRVIAAQIAEMSAAGEAIGELDGDSIYLDSISLPGIDGATGTMELSFETDLPGVLKAVFQTQGITEVAINTGDGLFDFDVRIVARDVYATLVLDFSNYKFVGPIVKDLQLGFAPGDDAFEVDVAYLPDFVEYFFVDDGLVRQEIANGIKDAVAPEISAVFTSVGGDLRMQVDVLGKTQELALHYEVENVRTVHEIVQIDLSASFPALELAPGVGAPMF